MSDRPTREKILDAAENLFVSGGFSVTSLRAIIKAAGVNTAAIHYHFGSREALVAAVLARRVGPINADLALARAHKATSAALGDAQAMWADLKAAQFSEAREQTALAR